MTWKRVCKVTDVPENTLKKFTVDDVTLVIANCALTCTKHLWSWDLNSLDMLGETERPLRCYEVKLENGDILAFIDKEHVYEFEDEDDLADDDFFSKA